MTITRLLAACQRKIGLVHEIRFWNHWLATRGRQYSPDEFHFRVDPASHLQDYIVALLPAHAASPARILDVGAGPLSWLGTQWPGHSVELIAVDPLAPVYDILLGWHGITPPVRTRFASAERLSKLFPHGYFDLVHARNSLDHGIDPLAALREMLAVLKPGRQMFLQHASHEASNQQYKGLHKWNFYLQDGDLMLGSRKRLAVNITEEFRPLATVRSSLDPSNMITTRIQKLPAT